MQRVLSSAYRRTRFSRKCLDRGKGFSVTLLAITSFA